MENTTEFPPPEVPKTRKQRFMENTRNRQIGRQYVWQKTKTVSKWTLMTAGAIALVSVAVGSVIGSDQDTPVQEEN